jgi:hypothetical protein
LVDRPRCLRCRQAGRRQHRCQVEDWTHARSYKPLVAFSSSTRFDPGQTFCVESSLTLRWRGDNRGDRHVQRNE